MGNFLTQVFWKLSFSGLENKRELSIYGKGLLTFTSQAGLNRRRDSWVIVVAIRLIMASSEVYEVVLSGGAPWGFRLQGGKEFRAPLRIAKVSCYEMPASFACHFN